MIRINLMRGVKIDPRMSWAEHDRLMRERADSTYSPCDEPAPAWVWWWGALLLLWMVAEHFV